jgi:ubiquinol-cytochrome c reductase cytochrome b subunit
MLVFAGMFHIYRHGTAMAKAPPPRPTTLPSPAKPMPSAPKPMPSIPKPSAEPLPAPPIQKASGTQVATQTSQTTTSTTTTIPASTSAPSDSKTENTKNDLVGRSTVQASKKLVDT